MPKSTAPAPKLALKLVADTGQSAADGITSNGALLATKASSTDVLTYRMSADGGATWSAWTKTTGVLPAPTTDGTWLVQVQEKTAKGKFVASTSLAFTLDTAAAAPTLTLVNDTGAAGDGLTSDYSVSVSGLETGARLQYSTDGGVTWNAAFAAQEGANSVLARQVDVAGNVSAASNLSFTLDTSAPLAGDDAAATLQDTAVTIAVLGNDDDASGLSLQDVGLAGNGSVSLNGDGTLAYTPDAGFSGIDTFSYVVVDAAGLASTATVQVTVEAAPAGPASPFTALDPAGVQPGQVVQALLAANAGIEVDAESVVWHASGTASTNLYDGSLAPLGIGTGLLLTSGTTPGTANTVEWFGTDNSTGWDTPGFNNGDADLDGVVNTVFSTVSYDATTLSFDFTVLDPAATSISFDLVFGSDEFPEWVDQFVDVAVVIVNGQNVALFDHDPMHPLSVIGSNLAGNYFMDNGAGVLPIEYDGVSARLKIVAPVHTGTNTIKIGIGDTGDHIYDSGVFLANFSAGNLPGSGVLIDDGSGTSGNDNSTGGAGSDLMDSGDGNDCVDGGAGDDVVLGGSGDDVVSGGTGSDQLVGGSGADEFDYSDLHDWAGEGLDTITDFAGNTAALADAPSLDAVDGDVLVFSHAALAGIAGAVMEGFAAPAADCFSTLSAGDLSQRTDGAADGWHAQFVYDAATGIVAFDPDGMGSAVALQVTLLGTLPAHLDAAWLVVGV
ncbi:MAG: choice-of-anchor L domain-containing protein [Burkholderiales bacterium]|nr:choice-of-anchor L domain-containing protein [Burkholderiales bacterium]